MRQTTEEAFVRTLQAHGIRDAFGIRAVQTFALGLAADGAAARSSVATPWSNAQAQGQIARLKLIKRQSYRRAGFDLLRRRVLYTP